MGEIQFTTSITMAALFTIALVMFAFGFAYDNDAAYSLANDPDLGGLNSSLSGDLITFNSSVASAGTNFEQDNLLEGSDTSASGAQFKGPQKANYGTAVTNLKSSFNKIFGSDFTILSVTLLTILSFIAIRLAYKTWWGKSPE